MEGQLDALETKIDELLASVDQPDEQHRGAGSADARHDGTEKAARGTSE